GLGDFKTVAHVAVADVRVGGGVQDDGAIDEHPVVVVAGGLGCAGVGPEAVVALDHVEGDVVDRDLDALCGGGGEVESDACVGFDARKLLAEDIAGRGASDEGGGGAQGRGD